MTTTRRAAPFYRLPLEPTPANGLREASDVMVDKIFALARGKCGEAIGRLSRDQIAALNHRLALVIGARRCGDDRLRRTRAKREMRVLAGRTKSGSRCGRIPAKSDRSSLRWRDGDGLVAATPKVCGLILLTRDVGDCDEVCRSSIPRVAFRVSASRNGRVRRHLSLALDFARALAELARRRSIARHFEAKFSLKRM